jgi:type II secretory pathway component PulL
MNTESPILFAGEAPTDAHRGARVVLALPSPWCLSATIDTIGLSLRDRRAGIFRLEEKLPVAAEDVVADIVPSVGRRSALGVCVRMDRLRDVVSLVESAGAAVHSIAPAALLAAQGSDDGVLVIESADASADVVAIEHDRPVAWGWSGSNPDEIRLQVELAARHLSVPPAPDAIRTISASAARQRMSAAAQRIVEGRARPFVELRRDALAPRDRAGLHRRPLNFALASAAALMLAITLAMVTRAVRYDRAARSSDSAMIDAFRSQFPDWPVPANVRAVVESERRKRGEGAAADSVSAMGSMRALMAAIPGGLRVAVDSMAFDAGSFEMSGRVNAQADVEALVAAARSAGFELAAPISRREPAGTWTFTMTGTRRSAVAGGAPSL